MLLLVYVQHVRLSKRWLRALKALLLPALLLLLAAPALAQEAPGVGFPQFSGEMDMGFYTQAGNAADRARRGSSSFLFGEIAGGLHLNETLSIQGTLHFDPAAQAKPNDSNIFFRDQAAFLESLFLNWRATPDLTLYAGKLVAPFGSGPHYFPGIFAQWRAHEVYLITESNGFGATWTYLSDARWGEHDISATLFTLDTSFLSTTLLTRHPCCSSSYDRYSRNYLRQGGAGNNGQLQNFAVSLDGDKIGWLPNFTYHLSMVALGQGKDGTAEEWGFTLGARYQADWGGGVRSLFFGEYVQFRDFGGKPLETGPTGSLQPVSELRQFGTLGVNTTWEKWRSALIWQFDQRKRSINTIPTQQWVEISVGRELIWGFGIDVGYQYARYDREDGRAGNANAFISRIGYRASF